MKKIDGYPYNGYPTDMGTGTWQIFIQRVRCGGATTRTLPAPLTSLVRMQPYLESLADHIGGAPPWTPTNRAMELRPDH